jgi:hypothetical protein
LVAHTSKTRSVILLQNLLANLIFGAIYTAMLQPI